MRQTIPMQILHLVTLVANVCKKDCKASPLLRSFWWVSHPATDRAKHGLTSVSTPPAALPLGHGAGLCQTSSSNTAAATGNKSKKNRLS